MQDLELIVKRNTNAINKLIEELNITRSLEQLINSFDRIFIHDDFKDTQRLRLLGIERTGDLEVKEEHDQNGNFSGIKTKEKRSQVQLYVLKKKEYLEIEESEKQYLISKLDLFIVLFKQLKAAAEIESLEINSMSFFKTNKQHLLKELDIK